MGSVMTCGIIGAIIHEVITDPTGGPPPRAVRTSVFEDERHLHVHPILRDLSALDLHFLLLDPGALDVLQSLVRARDPDAKGVFEALRARGRDLRDLCDCHSLLAPFWQ